MKRFFALSLFLVLLLTGCERNTVPAYVPVEAPTSLEQQETEPAPSSQEDPDYRYISEPEEFNIYDTEGRMLRLSRGSDLGNEGAYYMGNLLTRYDENLDKQQVCCTKEHCPHADDNCNAWIGNNGNGARLAVAGNLAYIINGPTNEYGYLTELRFFSLDLTTGERRMYHEVAAQEGMEIRLCDAVIYGSTAVLNYDLIGEAVYGDTPRDKEHSILSVDLASGEKTTVMKRKLAAEEIYDLWGMNESHIILAFHHRGGAYSSFGESSMGNYSQYAQYLHRWVLLEYPIEENAVWSKQIAASGDAVSSVYSSSTGVYLSAGADSEALSLYNYSNFYGGKLYYVIGANVMTYDLQTHKSSLLFVQPGITYLSCLDGRVFYQTDGMEYFWYEPETRITCQYQKGQTREVFLFSGETNDYFYGYYNVNSLEYSVWGKDFCRISKLDFYEENYQAAVPFPLY